MRPIIKAAGGLCLLLFSSFAWACTSAYNPITNCGFESGNFNGWNVQDINTPFIPAQVVGAGFSAGFGFFTTAPTEGTFASVNGFDGDGPGTIEYSQDITVPSDAFALVFDYRAGWDLSFFCGACTESRIFTVQIQPSGGGAPLVSKDLLFANPNEFVPDTGPRSGILDMSEYQGQDVRVLFLWTIPENFTGPAQFQLDNVQIAPPPPRIPTLSQVGLGAMALLLLLFGMAVVRSRTV